MKQRLSQETECVEGSGRVCQALENFACIPLLVLADGEAKSLRRYLQDLTGLSAARIAQGNLDALRPSRQAEVERHVLNSPQRLSNEEDRHLATKRTALLLHTAPKTSSGLNPLWASWIHGLDDPNAPQLKRSLQVALTVDELMESLVGACREDRWQQFRDALLNHLLHHGWSIRLEGEPRGESLSDDELPVVSQMQHWEDAFPVVQRMVEMHYLELISALDVQWGDAFFGRFRSMSLFPLVMARVRDDLLLGRSEPGAKINMRNWVSRPVRRLLEFMYAVVHWHYRKKWPPRAPTPKELAGKLDCGPEDVNNLFDGTRNLTVDGASKYWEALFMNFSRGTVRSDQIPDMPLPMVSLALHWQRRLVQGKDSAGERSVFLLDLESYRRKWQMRHQQWMGQRANDAVDWPGWLTNQSASLS